MSALVKVFGRRPLKNLSTRTGAGGPKTSKGGNRGWDERCENGSAGYGDFDAGTGLDVVERSSSARDFAAQHVRELGRERVAQRLCDAILCFRVLTDGDFDVTTQGAALSAWSQHGR